MKHIICLILLAFLFTNCETVVDLDYKSNQSEIVIEGNITDGEGPYYVKISQSLGLTDTTSYPPVNDAVVTVSDDAGNSEVLTFKGNGVYQTLTLEGVQGRTYTLNVETNEQTYTAQSTMPQKVAFDSIKIEEVELGGEIDYSFIPVYSDPADVSNNYRFVLSVNNELVSQHLVLNDEINNGLVNTLKLEIDDDDLDFEPGCFISIEMQCIDKSVSLYYTTLALMGNTGPGGGTTPNNPPSNISNGALGVFSAHTVETQSVTIP